MTTLPTPGPLVPGMSTPGSARSGPDGADGRLSRRGLLLAGATLAAGAVVGGRALLEAPPMAGTLEAVVRAGLPSLPVGFVDRTRSDGVLDLSGRPSVVPAATGRPGGLGSSATAQILGPTPNALDALDAAGADVDGLHLDALFPSAEGTDPVRFSAWTWRAAQPTSDGQRGPASTSPPVRFGVPVGQMSLGFDLTVSGSSTPVGSSVMTAGAEDALVRLRPGTYLLGLQPGLWEATGRLPALHDRAWEDLASVVVVLTPAG